MLAPHPASVRASPPGRHRRGSPAGESISRAGRICAGQGNRHATGWDSRPPAPEPVLPKLGIWPGAVNGDTAERTTLHQLWIWHREAGHARVRAPFSPGRPDESCAKALPGSYPQSAWTPAAPCFELLSPVRTPIHVVSQAHPGANHGDGLEPRRIRVTSDPDPWPALRRTCFLLFEALIYLWSQHSLTRPPAQVTHRALSSPFPVHGEESSKPRPG